jgi:prepilin peptidase CpaA
MDLTLTLTLAPALAVALAAVAAGWDWRTGTIPNWITLPPLALAPLGHLAVSGLPGLCGSILGIFACGLIPYLLFRRDAMGGGDVKMFAAIGGLIGVTPGIEAQVFALAVATVFTGIQLARRSQLTRVLRNTLRIAVNPVLPGRLRRPVPPELLTTIRLGPAILAGLVLSLAMGGSA